MHAKPISPNSTYRRVVHLYSLLYLSLPLSHTALGTGCAYIIFPSKLLTSHVCQKLTAGEMLQMALPAIVRPALDGRGRYLRLGLGCHRRCRRAAHIGLVHLLEDGLALLLARVHVADEDEEAKHGRAEQAAH